MPVFTRSVAVALCGLTAGPAAGAAGAETVAAWEEGAQLSFADAARHFARLGDSREARFGRAVMLVNAQPKTLANVAEGRALFLALRRERADDEPGIGALYYLARIAQFHEARPDLAAARTSFATLVAEHGDHFYGQLARFKLATLALYDAADTRPPAERLAAAEALGEPLHHPGIKRDFHLLAAEAHLRFHLSVEHALRHFLAAESGRAPVRDVVRAALFLQIGECARELGRHGLARRFYERFLAEFPRDARGATVRARLAGLPREVAP
ncbi:MAG: hypothetical protein HZC55_13330 [Verrucomicrobia bacterium]|nr:hypothetical protein [Verrucomicrobiota bacterium]